MSDQEAAERTPTDSGVAHVRPFTHDPALAYPRPQLRRGAYCRLDGRWGYATDDEDTGRSDDWPSPGRVFASSITVPFPPESPASGIGDRGSHRVSWYRREVTLEELDNAGGSRPGRRMLLRFGAVDYAADVWLSGRHLGAHEGGHTPFSFDITDDLALTHGPIEIVVRVEDDPRDTEQPRGKQYWRRETHGIWTERTTGIWQPVWLESVPELHIAGLSWTPDVAGGTVSVSVQLSRRPLHATDLQVVLSHEGERIAALEYSTSLTRSSAVISLVNGTNAYAMEPLLWSPETPRLIDAEVTVLDPATPDTVQSYFGLRSVGWADGHFLLNDRPYYIRGVLAQNYWPASHLAAPSDRALEEEVRLVKDLGFNTVRIHQKLEDPRFLAWADRLGLLVWAEAPSTFTFTSTSVSRLTSEWLAALSRDASHPSVVLWAPFNESWGVQQAAHSKPQFAFVQGLAALTRAVDPSRLLVTNDGWEHGDSDVITVHDYATRGEALKANYVDREAIDALLRGIGPLGRQMRLSHDGKEGRPVIVSEFGGVSCAPQHDRRGWGYVGAQSADDLERLLRDLFGAVQSSPALGGWIYTQLTDTAHELNGLVDAARRPKLPVETIRSIVRGDEVDTSLHRRPGTAVELPLPPHVSHIRPVTAASHELTRTGAAP